MRIWVDADACPNAVKEILFRAAIRTKITLILVANQSLRIPSSPFIKKIQVSPGFDVADNHIAQNIQHNDLVITADILLADIVVGKGCLALNPRGILYSKENIKQTLSLRNFNEALRDSGFITQGPEKLAKKNSQAFANALDKIILRASNHIKKKDCDNNKTK